MGDVTDVHNFGAALNISTKYVLILPKTLQGEFLFTIFFLL